MPVFVDDIVLYVTNLCSRTKLGKKYVNVLCLIILLLFSLVKTTSKGGLLKKEQWQISSLFFLPGILSILLNTGDAHSSFSLLLHSSNSHSPYPPSSSNAYSLLSSEQDNPSTSGCRLVHGPHNQSSFQNPTSHKILLTFLACSWSALVSLTET